MPFQVLQFTGTGSLSPQNPFQTIERQDVGLTLRVTPQINEGNSMVLAISHEISNIAQSAGGAVDLITNQRIVETTVLGAAFGAGMATGAPPHFLMSFPIIAEGVLIFMPFRSSRVLTSFLLECRSDLVAICQVYSSRGEQSMKF